MVQNESNVRTTCRSEASSTRACSSSYSALGFFLSWRGTSPAVDDDDVEESNGLRVWLGNGDGGSTVVESREELMTVLRTGNRRRRPPPLFLIREALWRRRFAAVRYIFVLFSPSVPTLQMAFFFFFFSNDYLVSLFFFFWKI